VQRCAVQAHCKRGPSPACPTPQQACCGRPLPPPPSNAHRTPPVPPQLLGQQLLDPAVLQEAEREVTEVKAAIGDARRLLSQLADDAGAYSDAEYRCLAQAPVHAGPLGLLNTLRWAAAMGQWQRRRSPLTSLPLPYPPFPRPAPAAHPTSPLHPPRPVLPCRAYATAILQAFGILAAGCDVVRQQTLPHLRALQATTQQLQAASGWGAHRRAAALGVWADAVSRLSDAPLPQLPPEAPVEWCYPPGDYVYLKPKGQRSRRPPPRVMPGLAPPAPPPTRPKTLLQGPAPAGGGLFD